MADEFKDIKSGDKIEPYQINIIYAELRRLRKMKGDSTWVSIDNANGDDGPCINFHPEVVIAKGTLSGALAKYTGSGTYPSATFVFDQFQDPVTGFVSTGISDTVYNDRTDKGVVINTRITAVKIDGYWFLSDVPDCVDLT